MATRLGLKSLCLLALLAVLFSATSSIGTLHASSMNSGETSGIANGNNQSDLGFSSKPESKYQSIYSSPWSVSSSGEISSYTLLDHTMASKVQESDPRDILQRSYSFSPEDPRAYSWLSFGKIFGPHQLEWRWYSPNGDLYYRNFSSIPDPRPNYEFWALNRTYSYIDIFGHNAANMPGNWSVDVYLDGQRLLTEHFSILTSALVEILHEFDLIEKGLNLSELKEYDEAIQAYDQAIKINPKNDVTWDFKGEALGASGKYNEAIDAFDEAIEINPQNDDAWIGKGMALYELGKYDDAINAFNKATEINPRYAKAWYYRGMTLVKLGKHIEAIEAFNKSAEINPDIEYEKGDIH